MLALYLGYKVIGKKVRNPYYFPFFEVLFMANWFKKGKNISFPLSQLAENPTRYLNQNIYVTGYIDSISNSYFCLTNIEKRFFLPVIYELGKNITIYPRQKVKIFARFSFDKKNFRYKLEINEQIHDIYSLKEE